ncbi:MAG TPA: TfoX/Sxy family protein [Candidatus Dormibacteraeota bacterium]|jgi:hypothetical protein|nr:TfoX/Sxy family protein [Candidatus Dormibacteraeota bacterium]
MMTAVSAGSEALMPKFAKSPQELVDRFDDLAALVPDASRRQMFGYPTCVLAGNMFMGLHEDRLILRLSEEDRRTFIEGHGAQIFEPMPGRPMKENVVVPPELVHHDAVGEWVARAHVHARGLPPKSPKATKGARAQD